MRQHTRSQVTGKSDWNDYALLSKHTFMSKILKTGTSKEDFLDLIASSWKISSFLSGDAVPSEKQRCLFGLLRSKRITGGLFTSIFVDSTAAVTEETSCSTVLLFGSFPEHSLYTDLSETRMDRKVDCNNHHI